MSQTQFLQDYILEVEKEFEYDGKVAEWAPGCSGPRLWGEEDGSLQLAQDDLNCSNAESAALAISPDKKLLAVATNAVIQVFSMSGKRLLAELVGHETNVWKLLFKPHSSSDQSSDRVKYLLLSAGAKVSGADGQIIVWNLDAEGKQLDRTMPFAIDSLSGKAVGAISAELKEHHDLDETSLPSLRESFAKTLRAEDLQNRVRHLSVLTGHFPGFDSRPLSHDGKAVLYLTQSQTTQHGMRPPEELPQIVVLDLSSRQERCRLRGHTDAIMWAAWSPDDKNIATASWDQTYKLWNAETGDCRHTIGPTGGQNWDGSFSPDGKTILFSGGRPLKIALYQVDTAHELSSLNSEGLDHWIRILAWRPHTSEIALASRRSVFIWKTDTNTRHEVLKLKSDEGIMGRFGYFCNVQWVEEGKKLLAQTTEGTVFVWEPERGVKWRFQRPRGMGLRWRGGGVLGLEAGGAKVLVSLDGDGRVRSWRL